ncbi:MAG: GNAT family N-acetyltransferase [Pseudomonadota bacterium]
MTLRPHERPIPGAASVFGDRIAAMLPRIETARLVLRAPRIEDYPVYLEIVEEPGGHFLLDGGTREDIWLDFAQMVATWLLRGHGLFAVDHRDAGDLIGFVLIGFEPGDHEPELGYLFRASARGQGYATEAAEAALAHAFGPLDLPSLVSTIDHDNIRSSGVSERLGARRDPAAEAAHGHSILVFRHTRPETLA